MSFSHFKSSGISRVLSATVCMVVSTVMVSVPAFCSNAVIFNRSGIFLENPAAVEKLGTILEKQGYTTSTTKSNSELEKSLDDKETTLLVFGPCEGVTDGVAERLKTFLRRGGVVITGGGMPFWYRFDEKGAALRGGANIMMDTAGVGGGFLGESSATLSAVGRKLFGRESAPSGVRALSAVANENLLVPLASVGDAHPVAAISYPGGGKMLYAGSMAIEQGLLTPIDNEATWGRVLSYLKTPFPSVEVKVDRDDWLSGRDKAVSASFILENPSDQPISLSGTAVLRKEKYFGFERESKTLFELPFSLAPKQKIEHKFTIPMPQSRYWGVYKISFVADSGFQEGTTFHVFPPAAISYVDINPVYPRNPRDPRMVTVGIHSSLPKQSATLLIETRKFADDNAKWHEVQRKTLQIGQSAKTNMTVFTTRLSAPGEDVIVRASLIKDGAVIHDYANRIEFADHNRALDRRNVMMRALNGSQFVDPNESEALKQNLLDWRKEMPLFSAVQPFTLPGDSREWLRKNDFEINYGQLLTLYPLMDVWKLDDRDGSGQSPVKYMPGHPEEVTSWLVRQHSREYFQSILDRKPDIVNLVEAVAGYETPGDVPNRKGNHSHFLGYTPQAIPNYREALSGKDDGVRMLDSGGRTIKRYLFKDLYEQLYDEKMPTPQEVGFKSWDEYVPIKLTLQNEGGIYENPVDALKYRLHYYLRSYFHMKRLDELSANLRAFAPEIHCVIGHDGPLVAQVSSQYYRLPYIDTQTRWLFRSAYIHAKATTYGEERTWIETAKRFGRRVGAHEELGAGQWASYRTAETSFVSLFTKRAALDYTDLQVDFFHTLAKKYRVEEEKAMFKGFQLAVDSEAKPYSVKADTLLITNNGSYYPNNYRGDNRWNSKTPGKQVLGLYDLLTQSGIPIHSVQTPIWDTQLLQNYRIVCLSADRTMKGDVAVLNLWLRDRNSAGRVLFINHASSLQINNINGFSIPKLGWGPLSGWNKLGLSLGSPQVVGVERLENDKISFKSSKPVYCLAVTPPAGAKVLFRSEKGVPIVWEIEVGRNRLIYSGLPANNVTLNEDPEKLTLQALGELFKELACKPEFMVGPKDWFGCGYRLNGNRLALAVINPKEEKIANDGPYGDDGDKVEQVAAALGLSKVELFWHKGGVPNREYKVRDAWTNELLPQTIKADAEGNIRASFEVNVAKLYVLE